MSASTEKRNSQAWPNIERARNGERGSTRPRSEHQAPHLQVICSSRGDAELLPALAFTSNTTSHDFLWIRHPENARKTPVAVYRHEDAVGPEAVITSTDSRTVQASSADGRQLWIARKTGGSFRTRWVIENQGGAESYSLTERKRDAWWNRTIRPFTVVDAPGLEWLGPILFLLIFPALFRPPIRLTLARSDGKRIGEVTYGSAGVRPREGFCLYLDDEPLPLQDMQLALGVVTAVQGMR